MLSGEPIICDKRIRCMRMLLINPAFSRKLLDV